MDFIFPSIYLLSSLGFQLNKKELHFQVGVQLRTWVGLLNMGSLEQNGSPSLQESSVGLCGSCRQVPPGQCPPPHPPTGRSPGHRGAATQSPSLSLVVAVTEGRMKGEMTLQKERFHRSAQRTSWQENLSTDTCPRARSFRSCAQPVSISVPGAISGSSSPGKLREPQEPLSEPRDYAHNTHSQPPGALSLGVTFGHCSSCQIGAPAGAIVSRCSLGRPSPSRAEPGHLEGHGLWTRVAEVLGHGVCLDGPGRCLSVRSGHFLSSFPPVGSGGRLILSPS